MYTRPCARSTRRAVCPLWLISAIALSVFPACQDSPTGAQGPSLEDPGHFGPVKAILATSIVTQQQFSGRSMHSQHEAHAVDVSAFAINRLQIFMSEVQPDGWMSRAWVYRQPTTVNGSVPVFFSSEIQSLTDFDTSELRPKLDMIFIQSSAHAVYDGEDWYGLAYGVDHTYYPADSRGQQTHGFYLYDRNYYRSPETGDEVNLREYRIVFVNREILGFDDRSFLLHFTKIDGQGDNDPENDVWEYGELTLAEDARLTVVEWIMEYGPFPFEGAEATSTNDVYFLFVPMEPIVLSSERMTRITLQIDTSSLVTGIDRASQPVATEYSLDSDNAPISFRVSFEQFDPEELDPEQ